MNWYHRTKTEKNKLKIIWREKNGWLHNLTVSSRLMCRAQSDRDMSNRGFGWTVTVRSTGSWNDSTTERNQFHGEHRRAVSCEQAPTLPFPYRVAALERTITLARSSCPRECVRQRHRLRIMEALLHSRRDFFSQENRMFSLPSPSRWGL